MSLRSPYLKYSELIDWHQLAYIESCVCIAICCRVSRACTCLCTWTAESVSAFVSALQQNSLCLMCIDSGVCTFNCWHTFNEGSACLCNHVRTLSWACECMHWFALSLLCICMHPHVLYPVLPCSLAHICMCLPTSTAAVRMHPHSLAYLHVSIV